MKKLYRSKKDRMIFGICGGLGELFDVDPNIFRIGLVLIGIATGIVPALIAYLVAWFLLPLRKTLESTKG